MISEEKAIHLIHLVIEGLQMAGLAEYPNKDLAMREAKQVCFKFVSGIAAAADVARSRILSQKSAPPEGSPQWDTLFRKYYEDELHRRGG